MNLRRLNAVNVTTILMATVTFTVLLACTVLVLKIYPTMIAAYSRRPTVTVKEAIFFLIDHNSDEPLRPTELLRDLTTRFIPPYTYSEVQDEISKLLEENVILLTPNLRVARQKSS